MEEKKKTESINDTEVNSIFSRDYYIKKLRDAGGIKSRSVKGVIQMCLIKVSNLTVGHVLAARTIFPDHAVLKWIKLGVKMTPELEKQFSLYTRLTTFLREHVHEDDVEEWKKLLDETKYTWPKENSIGWESIFEKVPELCLKIKESSSNQNQRIEFESNVELPSTESINSDDSSEKENLSLKEKDFYNNSYTSSVKQIDQEGKDKLTNVDTKLVIETSILTINDKNSKLFVGSQQETKTLIQNNSDQQQTKSGIELEKISSKKTDDLILNALNERQAKDKKSKHLKENVSESVERVKENEKEQESEAVFDIDALMTEELDYDMISSPEVENEEEDDDNIEEDNDAEWPEDSKDDIDVTPDIEYDMISSPESQDIVQLENDISEQSNSEEFGGGEEFKQYLSSELKKNGLIKTIQFKRSTKKILAKSRKSSLRVVLVLAAICNESFSPTDVRIWIEKIYGILIKKNKMTRQIIMYQRLLDFLLYRVPKRLLRPWKGYFAGAKYVLPTNSKENWINVFGKHPALCKSIEVNESLGVHAYNYKSPSSHPSSASIDVFQSLECDRISSDDSDFETDDKSDSNVAKSSEENTSNLKDTTIALEVENIESSEGSDLEENSRDTNEKTVKSYSSRFKENNEEKLYTQMIDSPEDLNLLKEQDQQDRKFECVSPIRPSSRNTTPSELKVSPKPLKTSYEWIKASSRTFRNIVILGKDKYTNDFKQLNNLNLTFHEMYIKFEDDKEVFKNLQAEMKKNSQTMWILLTDFSTWSKTSNFCSNTFKENDCKESLSIYSASDLHSSEVCDKVISFITNVLTSLDKSSAVLVAPVTPQTVLCPPDDHLMLQDFHDIVHFSPEAKEIPICKESDVRHFNSFGEDYVKIVEQVMKMQKITTQLLEEFVKKRVPVLDKMEDPLQCSGPGDSLNEWSTFMKALFRWLSVSSGPHFDVSCSASPGPAGMSSNLSGVSSGSLSPTPTIAAASTRPPDTPPSPISRTSTPLSGVSSCPLSPGADDKSPRSLSPKISGASVVSPASVVSLAMSAASSLQVISPESVQLPEKSPTDATQVPTAANTDITNQDILENKTPRQRGSRGGRRGRWRARANKLIINHYSMNLKKHHLMKLVEACGNVNTFEVIREYSEDQSVEYCVGFANLWTLYHAHYVLKDLKVLDTRLNVSISNAKGAVYEYNDNDKSIVHCRAQLDQIFKEMNLFPGAKGLSSVAQYKSDIQSGPVVNPSVPVSAGYYGSPPAASYPSKDLISSTATSWNNKEADLARKASEFVAANEAKLFVAANEAKIAKVSRSLSRDGRNMEGEIVDRGRQMKDARIQSSHSKKYGRLSSEHIERNYKSPERFKSRSPERFRSRSPKYRKISRSPDWEDLNRKSPFGRRLSSPYRKEGHFSISPERTRSRSSPRRGGHGSGSSQWQEDHFKSRRSRSPAWRDETSRSSHDSKKIRQRTVRIPDEGFRSRSPPWVEDKVLSRSPDRRLHSRSPKWMGENVSKSPEWIDSPEHISMRSRSPKRKRSYSPERRGGKGASPKYNQVKERYDTRKEPQQIYTEIEIVHMEVDQVFANKVMLLLTPILWQCGGVNVPDLRLRIKSKNRDQGGPSPSQRLVFKFKDKSTAVIVSKFLNDFRIPDMHLKVKALVDNVNSVHIDPEENRAVITTLMQTLRSNQSLFITHLQDVGARPGAFTNNIFTYKTRECKDVNKRCKVFKSCIYYHSKADQRRDIRVIKYMDIDCNNGPDVCPQGDKCNKSHNKAESIFHPRRIHKNICQEWYAEKKCARSDVCISAHPESPEVLFNDIWRDLFVSGLKQSYQYLVGAVQNMRFLKTGLPGIYVLVITPTVYVANWLAGAVMDLADNHQQEIAVVSEDTGDIGNAKIVVGTPAGVVNVVRSGRVEVSRTLAGLILDDASLLLTQHRTHIHTLAQILNVHYGTTELDINRVVVAEEINQWEVDVLSSLLNTTFLVVGEVVPGSDTEPVLAREQSDGQGVVRGTKRLDSPPRFKAAASIGSPISPARPRDWSPLRKSAKAPSPPRWPEVNKSASSVVPRGQAQGFSVRNVLSALGSVADYMGVIGHSLKALLSRTEQCVSDSDSMAVMKERDNKMLLEMVKTKLDNLSDTATGIQQAKLFRDVATKTKLLMDQMVEGANQPKHGKKHYGLDIDMMSLVTVGKDVPYIIKFIRSSLDMEGIMPDKANISEIYELICEGHIKMKDSSTSMQPTAVELIQKLQKENKSFSLQPASTNVEQRISGHRSVQMNDWQSEYPKNQSTKESTVDWESRKHLRGNNEDSYSGQSNYPSGRWPQVMQPQERGESNIQYNNPPPTNPHRHLPPQPKSTYSSSSHGPSGKSFPPPPSFVENKPYPPMYSSNSQPPRQNKTFGHQQSSTEVNRREMYLTSGNDNMQSQPSGSTAQSYQKGSTQNYPPSFGGAGQTNYNPQANINPFPEANSNTYQQQSSYKGPSQYQGSVGPVHKQPGPVQYQQFQPPPPGPGNSLGDYHAPPQQRGPGDTNQYHNAGRGNQWY